ncbi:uncharacterized protein LOC107785517 [Nicotiana tabacum]|uniref:Uncharacterized protein LOC107785517 n=2 Tax=Nicotiana TaxID=4085 RepID=A0A1S3ZDC3_TOBAC|nr:PREDICTED: uncharacterized protein LOC104223613 [Nicotiana sylvestris]XP_016462329.1 PREDICTED: uncharacterized protein LOC107785517 [Nicotiana tabacum]
MEIEGTNGSKTLLKPGSTREFGRGLGFTADDRTVSRRQISFQLQTSSEQEDETKVNFEVVGRNPIWVYSNKDGKVRTFRKFEKGEMVNGDMFCVSANKPIWFTLRRIDFDDEDQWGVKKEMEMESQLAESLQSSSCPVGIELDLENIDIFGIDPVQEFGFLVMGHEFDGYPKRMIREIKNWDWFIEEERAESDADEGSDRKGKKGARRKRKKKGEGDDEEWTGESEDEKELLSKSKKLQGPKYVTRSKDKSNAKKKKPSPLQKTRPSEEEYEEEEEEEDEEDETLGGFIVDDVEEEAEAGEEEEEEEFDAGEDDEELED